MKQKYIWIGPRYSDIDGDTFFENSITTYGNNKYSFCQHSKIRDARGSSNEIIFIENAIQELNALESDYQYMLYDQSEIVNFSKNLTTQFVCTNPPHLVNILNSKEFTRSWLSNEMNCLPFVVMPFSDVNYKKICRLFPGVDSFIIQNIYGVGGTKTHLINKESLFETIAKKYKPYEVSIISPYISNSISFNVHILCGIKKSIVFPYSAQIINQCKERLLYAGCNFNFQTDNCINYKIYEAACIISEKLINLGYRGIAGIDFLWANNTLYFVEINPRFQGSTRLLNIWLRQYNYPSIYQLHYDMFIDKEYDYNFSNVSLPYMSYNYISDVSIKPNLPSNAKLILRDLDGWNDKIKCCNNVYMYRDIYETIQ